MYYHNSNTNVRYIFSNYILNIKKANRWKKFHSAEHMVLNAYRKLNRIPSLEETRNFPKFSNTCGTNGMAQISITFILIFFTTFIPNLDSIHIRILIILSAIIALILSITGCLNFMQKFTTDIPTDTELKVAIKGMEVWLENEQKPKAFFKK